MAKINKLGNITASSPGCNGSTSTFEYMYGGRELGFTIIKVPKPYRPFNEEVDAQFRLYRCAGCGMGGLGFVKMRGEVAKYPADIYKLVWFMPEAKQRLPLPKAVPEGIRNEFREGGKV
jgi:hypothetical protein